jgi:hypothetical protein
MTLSPVTPGGTSASAPAPAAAPSAADPSGFSASLQGDKVTLSWQAVPGISWYLLGGPGVGQYGQRVQGTSYTFNSPGPGQHEWTVASLEGQNQGPVNNWVNWPKATLSIESKTGSYRIMVAGIRAEHATKDDPWSSDGKWDEVYFSAYTQTFDRESGQLLASGTVKSPVHGDINGFPPGSRVRAGSASELGGITDGDQVSPFLGQPSPGAQGYPQMVVWQGTLTSDREVVVIHPVLWEADRGPNNTEAFNAWQQFFEQNPTREWSLSSVEHPDPQAASWFQEGGTVRLSGGLEPMAYLDGNTEDRPIGMQNYGVYPCSTNCAIWLDHMLILTRERIEKALNSPYSSAERELLELRLTDYIQTGGSRLINAGLQGDYVIVFRIDRI